MPAKSPLTAPTPMAMACRTAGNFTCRPAPATARTRRSGGTPPEPLTMKAMAWPPALMPVRSVRVAAAAATAGRRTPRTSAATPSQPESPTMNCRKLTNSGAPIPPPPIRACRPSPTSSRSRKGGSISSGLPIRGAATPTAMVWLIPPNRRSYTVRRKTTARRGGLPVPVPTRALGIPTATACPTCGSSAIRVSNSRLWRISTGLQSAPNAC